MPTTERVFQIFKELNQIPRPSHHGNGWLTIYASLQNDCTWSINETRRTAW